MMPARWPFFRQGSDILRTQHRCCLKEFRVAEDFPDNVPSRNVFQAIKNGFFVDYGMFHQPLNRNDFHVAGIYFVYPPWGIL
jgi:hypothetical protein